MLIPWLCLLALGGARALSTSSALSVSSVLSVASALSMASVLSGWSASSGACPEPCDCGELDGDREYVCRGDGYEVAVRGRADEYAVITCKRGTIDPSSLPLLPFSDNGTLDSVHVQACALTGTLKSVLDRLGASEGPRSLTVSAPKGPLTRGWLEGIREIERLEVLQAEEQRVVPWDVIDALPALRDYRQREGNVSLEEDDDSEITQHPSLRVVELTLLGAGTLPPRLRTRLARVTHLYVWGNNFTDITEGFFDGLDSLQTLDISRNPFRELRAHSFAALPRLRSLTLVGSALVNIRAGAFEGLGMLEKVELKMCRRANVTLEPLALAALPALKTLTVEHCKLAPLPDDLLHGSQALEEITISKTPLKALPEPLFAGLQRVQRLDLRQNALTALPARALRPLKALKELRLDDNKIKELPDGLLSGLSQLRIMSAERNGMTSIGHSALQGASALETLSLAENQLSFDSEEPSGDYWSLGASSPLASLTRLRSLTLRHNRVTRVASDWRAVLLQLHTLDLAHNNITELNPADVEFLTSNATIDLRHNRISVVGLYGGAAPAPPSSNTLLLDQNPFRCDCDLYSLVQRLHNLTFPISAEARLDLGDARCASPPALAGRPLRSLPPAALACPLRPRDCPRPCTCHMRPATGALELDCQQEPPEYPDPNQFGLIQTHLRLHQVDTFNLPPHVTVLELPNVGLTQPPALELIPNVKLLDLSYNNFTEAPMELLTSNMTLRLSGNPFLCDCAHSQGVAGIQKFVTKILDKDNVTCSGGEPVWNVDAGRLCDLRRAILLGGSLAILGVVAAVVAGLVYRYMLEIKLFLFSRGWCGSLIYEDEVDKGSTFDAFVSFSQEDAKWVAEKLVPVLEDQYHFKLCVHYRDWIVGDMIPAQIARSVEESRRTIVVLSQSFLKSTWALLEFRAANQRAQKERRARVLVVVLDDATERQDMDAELRAYLNTNTYLRWSDPWFWEKLRYAMPHKKPVVDLHAGEDKIKRGALDASLNADGKIVNNGLISVIKPHLTVDL